MKTALRLCLVLTFCFVAFCSMRDFSTQITGLSISIPKNNAAPFFKIVRNNTLYYAKIQSLYEIYQRNDSTWYKLPDTETKFNSLNWNSTLDFENDTITLIGAPCPCLDRLEQHEQFLSKRHITNNYVAECPVVPFDYIRFSISLNNENCSAPDLDTCVSNCTQYCESSTNNTACEAGCNAFTDISFLDTNTCNTTCGNDTICWDACYSQFECLTNTSCSLQVSYHLHRYQWSNISDLGENITRKLVFSFKIIPQYDQQQCCGTQFDHWIRGNYSLIFNTTTLSLDFPNVTLSEYDSVNISNATEIPSTVVWALRGEAVFGRVYFDDLVSGYSLFNNYPTLNLTVPVNTTEDNSTAIPDSQARRTVKFGHILN